MTLTTSQISAFIANLPTEILSLVESHPELVLDREKLIEGLLKARIVSERTNIKPKDRIIEPQLVTTFTLEISFDWNRAYVPSWESLKGLEILEPVEKDGEWYDCFIHDSRAVRTDSGVRLERIPNGDGGIYTQLPYMPMLDLD